MTIDPRAEGKSHTKFIGGFSRNFPKALETPPKDATPPPPSLRPANGRVLHSRRQSSSRMAFPVPMHNFTPSQMPTPNREGSGQSQTMGYAQEVLTQPVPPKDFPRKSLLPLSDMGVGNPTALDQKTRPSSDASLPRPLLESQHETRCKNRDR